MTDCEFKVRKQKGKVERPQTSLYHTMDNELLRVWHLVHELSEQLAQNQKIAGTLQSQASILKVCKDI